MTAAAAAAAAPVVTDAAASALRSLVHGSPQTGPWAKLGLTATDRVTVVVAMTTAAAPALALSATAVSHSNASARSSANNVVGAVSELLGVEYSPVTLQQDGNNTVTGDAGPGVPAVTSIVPTVSVEVEKAVRLCLKRCCKQVSRKLSVDVTTPTFNTAYRQSVNGNACGRDRSGSPNTNSSDGDDGDEQLSVSTANASTPHLLTLNKPRHIAPFATSLDAYSQPPPVVFSNGSLELNY